MHILIPAAGLGRRMKSFGPKALIPVAGGERVVARQLRLLREAFPGSPAVVVTGFEADKLKRALPEDVRVVENHDFEETNVAHSLRLGLRHCGDEVLIVYADLVFTRLVSAALAGEGSRVLVRDGAVRSGQVGVNVEEGRVLHFSHGLPHSWAQLALLRGRELDLFRGVAGAEHRRRHFGHELLNEVLERGGVLWAQRVPGAGVLAIDCSKDIDRARKMP